MRTRPALALVAFLLVGLALSGCLRGLTRPDLQVARTPVETDDWNTGGVFSVQVNERDPVPVRIQITASDGRAVEETGISNATLPAVDIEVPDGVWTIRYYLDGDKWETFRGTRWDSTPPAVSGLATVGETQTGEYTIGAGASVEPGATVRVVDQATGATIGTTLPLTVRGLGDGLRAYDVIVTDEAGNRLVEQVQVRSGSATALPEGQFTFGLVARYTLAAELWDISDLGAWVAPAAARDAVGGEWLGAGRGVAPGDAAVRQVVEEVVDGSMSTGEAAFALYRWMADNLEYDQERLEATTLLRPHQTLLDREDAGDGDSDGDGFVRDGAGNGVRGGVCRDLAAAYVSLLRGAGVPARLVTGYLGGEVNGFHAWVEFYGGPGHGPSPWVPVDVSGIDGPYSPQAALQSFGLRHTDMLPLQVVSGAQEQDSWSTAVGVSTRFPQGKDPDVRLEKDLAPQFQVEGTLCVNPERLARLLIPQADADDCPHDYTHGIPRFVRSASQVLDYGATVGQAAPGTTVTLTLAYPDPVAVSPGDVEAYTYCSPAGNCAPFAKDAARGVTVGTWSR